MCLYFLFLISRLCQNFIFMAELGLRESEQKLEKVMNHSANKRTDFYTRHLGSQ